MEGNLRDWDVLISSLVARDLTRGRLFAACRRNIDVVNPRI